MADWKGDEDGNTVWLTAYATWVPPSPHLAVRLTIVRDGTTEVCIAEDSKGGGPKNPITTALTCCDPGLTAGSHTYTLRATYISRETEETIEQTIPFTFGTLTATEVNT